MGVQLQSKFVSAFRLIFAIARQSQHNTHGYVWGSGQNVGRDIGGGEMEYNDAEKDADEKR